MSSTQRVVIGIIVAAALVSLGSAFYFYSAFNKLKADPQRIAQEESKALLAEVGKLIVLPEGEEPTIATVTDPDLLKDQPFFANAKKGDKVLIYTNARKAILYNPELNKIIEVAPVSIGPTSPIDNTQATSSNNKKPTTTAPR